MLKFDSKQLPLYAGVITFVVLTAAALLFANKFSFLQSKAQDNDSAGKCPKKCCTACSLNLPLVLAFSAGLGVAAAVVAGLAQKEHRDKLKSLFQSGGSPALPSPATP